MIKRIHFVVLTLITLILSVSQVRASHAAGAEITYQWISGTTYQIIFKFYRDCNGIAEPTSVDCCYYNTCGGGVSTVVLNKAPAPNGLEVGTGCPGFSSTCNGGGNPGYREWIYTNTVTLPSQCNYWRFYVSISARNTGQYNIADGGNLYVETTFDNLAAQGNSSPYFTVKPVPYMCVNSPFTFNNGAVDPNGDSLSFEMIRPRTGPTTCTTNPNPTDIPWTTAFNTLGNTVNNPLSTNNTFNLDPVTGQMSFTPNIQQVSTITMLCREWRNGQQIGTIMRDIQVIVLNCTNVSPSIAQDTASISGLQLVNGQVQGCVAEPMSFCFNLKSSDTSAILVPSDNHAISTPGATITYVGVGTDSVRACFSWTPALADSGLNILTVTVKDSSCKPPGIVLQQTFAIPIYIWPPTRTRTDTTVCQYAQIQLWAQGGTQFSWTALPGGSGTASLSCTNCQYPIATPSVTTSYVVTSTAGNDFCGHNKDTVKLTVIPPPNFNAGPDLTTCVGETIQLNANIVPTPGNTYSVLWTPSTYLNNDTLVNPTSTPTNDITYIVKVTPSSVGACAGYDTIKVSVLKGFTVFNNDTAICKGQSVQINAIGDSRYTYTWTPAIGVSNTSILNPQITPPDTSHLYTVKASYPGCHDSVHQIYIDVQPVPTVFVGADQVLCYGDTVHLSATVTPSSYPNYSYIWTPSGGLTNPSTANPVFTAMATTTLTLTVTTPAGCKGNDDVKMEVIAADFINTSNDTGICPREIAQLHVTGPTIQSVVWRPNINIDDTLSLDPKVWPVTTTYYTVIARDTNYCLDTERIKVTIAPEAVINLPDSARIFPGQSYQIDPNSNCLYFQWFPPLGLSATNIANPIASPAVNTRYFVQGVTEFGCSTVDSMDILVSQETSIDVPNAFSPGSAPNSILHVVHSGDATLKSFTIYNRWGTKVFETSNINEGWDGKFNGQPQPMGVYVYQVEAVTSTGRKFVKQGNITLIR